MTEPSQTVALIWQNFTPNCAILDLGCGQGKDSLFLASHNFVVTAVDCYQEAISVINRGKEKLNFSKLEAVLADINDFEIINNVFQVIICRNVLNFFKKERALELVSDFKRLSQENAYLIIDVFTKEDPSFIWGHKFACYFEKEELLRVFIGWEIVYYFEGLISDPAHDNYLTPHQHGVARIIAKKISC